MSNRWHSISRLLNFVDGPWPTSSEERILVFTTNYKEQPDLAPLRPGRMDIHIHGLFSSPMHSRGLGFQQPCRWLMTTHRSLRWRVDEGEAKVTPKEVAEELMRSHDADVALQGQFNHSKGRKTKLLEPWTTDPTKCHQATRRFRPSRKNFDSRYFYIYAKL